MVKKAKAVDLEPTEPEKKVEKYVPPGIANNVTKKKKLNKADFMFKSLKNEVCVKEPGDINGIDFMIKDLDGCTVVLLDHIA